MEGYDPSGNIVEGVELYYSAIPKAGSCNGTWCLPWSSVFLTPSIVRDEFLAIVLSSLMNDNQFRIYSWLGQIGCPELVRLDGASLDECGLSTVGRTASRPFDT